MELQPDLRFLVPLQPGQKVVVFDATEVFINALRADDVEVTIGSSLPAAPEFTFDHVIVPVVTPTLYPYFPREFARILRPGGSILAGFGNAAAFERLLLWRTVHCSRRPVFLSLRRCKRILGHSGLVVTRCYGVWENLEQPQYLLPLEKRNSSRFFFNQLFCPYSRISGIATKAADLITFAGLHSSLYRYFTVIAHREVDS